MSSHYIWIACKQPSYEKRASIYTGNVDPEDFENTSWEGETVYGWCDEHLAEGVSS